MGKSSISRHDPAELHLASERLSATMDPVLRAALGATLRRHRVARLMTQASMGYPLTRAYVSAVELGRTVPSLPALTLMVTRLDVTLSQFFTEVEAATSSGT